jgi:hypothetical protein
LIGTSVFSYVYQPSPSPCSRFHFLGTYSCVLCFVLHWVGTICCDAFDWTIKWTSLQNGVNLNTQEGNKIPINLYEWSKFLYKW